MSSSGFIKRHHLDEWRSDALVAEQGEKTGRPRPMPDVLALVNDDAEEMFDTVCVTEQRQAAVGVNAVVGVLFGGDPEEQFLGLRRTRSTFPVVSPRPHDVRGRCRNS